MSTKKPKEERKTADLTSREFFQNTSGSEPPKMKQKHRQKPTKKHKPNTNTQKQKFAPENFPENDP